MKISEEQKQATAVETLFSVLADPTRCRILMYLASAGKEGKCVSDVAETLKLSHSATSHQLNKMERLDIVERYRVGQSIYYNLAKTDVAKKLLKALKLFYR